MSDSLSTTLSIFRSCRGKRRDSSPFHRTFSLGLRLPPPNHCRHYPTLKSFISVLGSEATASSSWSSGDGSLQDQVSVELQPITSELQFDRIIAEAQQLEESIIIVWMAAWCRKCIYLKPKLEKLAADYYPRIRFYCIDVNTIPQRLVNCAGVTKMPTIQLWKDSEKQSEVIGGHKAWLVVSDVREMIENEF